MLRRQRRGRKRSIASISFLTLRLGPSWIQPSFGQLISGFVRHLGQTRIRPDSRIKKCPYFSSTHLLLNLLVQKSLHRFERTPKKRS